MSRTIHSQRQALRNTRRVWAAVSATPRRSLYAIADDLQLNRHTVYAALHRLHDAGYITWNRRGHHELAILVPFIITSKEE